jgi:hypothetical protein
LVHLNLNLLGLDLPLRYFSDTGHRIPEQGSVFLVLLHYLKVNNVSSYLPNNRLLFLRVGLEEVLELSVVAVDCVRLEIDLFLQLRQFLLHFLVFGLLLLQVLPQVEDLAHVDQTSYLLGHLLEFLNQLILLLKVLPSLNLHDLVLLLETFDLEFNIGGTFSLY